MTARVVTTTRKELSKQIVNPGTYYYAYNAFKISVGYPHVSEMNASNTSSDSGEITLDTDKEFYELAVFINGEILYPCICIPGLLGNILTLVVLSQTNMLSSTNAFLSALAVSDMVSLLNDLVYFSVMVLSNSQPEIAYHIYVHVYPFAHFVFNISNSVSSWLTVSVAIERFLLVCFPAKSRTMCTRPRAIAGTIVINVVMLTISLPYAFRYKTIQVVDNWSNKTSLQLNLTDLWQEDNFSVYYSWSLNFLRCNIPLILLIILNACIIKALLKLRAKNRSRYIHRQRVTFMLIIIIMKFLFCTTPDAVLSTFYGYGYTEDNFKVRGIREFTDMLLALNAATNFVVYCVLSVTFRMNCRKLFCHREVPNGALGKRRSVYKLLSDRSIFWKQNKKSSCSL
ncbi:FMRFamide receptor-like isoform X1 [Crassostrea virginica]|uniref:FMRFamide receptor-like isoform X1 n=1 Tax=Crassostrea virginica TaxID=6565 RepID=A0A8B8BI40_CRAVI|nr:FMRFamide receptor-like isoform X1 [Crassostrea virginica]